MVWYITYVVCNNWARDFMNTPVYGNINVALVFGLLQFVSTFLIAWLYSRHAREEPRPAVHQDPRGVRGDDRPMMITAMLPLATGGNQYLTIGLVPARRRPDPLHHLLGLEKQQDDHRLLRRRPVVLRLPERARDRRRLHVGRVVPRHLRRHRPVRLRRLPLLHRLPGGLAGGAAADRGAAAELRPLHHGRPAGVPDAPGTGPQRRRHLDDRGLDLLPAGADGRRRQPGRAAARRRLAGGQEPGDRRASACS